MKIAAITVFCNEIFRLEKWKEYYNDYQYELYLHIIINNGNIEDSIILKNEFPTSIIIETQNKALTAAYNLGIKYALNSMQIDSIMLIGNDMKFPKGNMTLLHDFLYSNEKYGIVSPIILIKDSLDIENYGSGINKDLSMSLFQTNININNVEEKFKIVECVPGGMNMAKRVFYEEVGLQDEFLFMYSDEIDTGLRARQYGYYLATTKISVAWHQHIYADKKSTRRHPFTKYLMARNKVYLAKKHFGYSLMIFVFVLYVIKSVKSTCIMLIKSRSELLIDYRWQLLGAVNGMLGIMKQNKFTQPPI